MKQKTLGFSKKIPVNSTKKMPPRFTLIKTTEAFLTLELNKDVHLEYTPVSTTFVNGVFFIIMKRKNV